MMDTRTVVITYFKESGKYYMETELLIDAGEPLFGIIEVVKQTVFLHHKFPYALMTAKDPNDDVLVPHLFVNGGELARQSVTDGEIQAAISSIEESLDHGAETEYCNGRFSTKAVRTVIAALQRTQMPNAIQWTGKNLREVIDLIGLNPSADKWTWADYEQVVAEHGLKVFTPDGPIMAEIGDWIVYNGKDSFVTSLRQFRKPEPCELCSDGVAFESWPYCPNCGRLLGGDQTTENQPTCKAAQIPCEQADSDGLCKIPECIKPGKRADLAELEHGCDTCRYLKQSTSANPCCLCKRGGFLAVADHWQPAKGGDRP